MLKEDIVAFPWQWLDKRATMLRYTYIAYLVYCLFVACSSTLYRRCPFPMPFKSNFSKPLSTYDF